MYVKNIPIDTRLAESRLGTGNYYSRKANTMKSILRSVRAVAESAKALTKKLLIKLVKVAIAAEERKLNGLRHLRWKLTYTGRAQGAE